MALSERSEEQVCGKGRAEMRIGNTEIRPLGGAWGCLAMIAVSILLSIFCTIGLNLIAR